MTNVVTLSLSEKLITAVDAHKKQLSRSAFISSILNAKLNSTGDSKI